MEQMAFIQISRATMLWSRSSEKPYLGLFKRKIGTGYDLFNSEDYPPLLRFLFHYSQGFWGNEFPEGKIKYDPEKYVCLKTTDKLALDGKINEKAWEKRTLDQ